jgi:hypothetical protein
MTEITYSFTYDIVTPESAEQGDTSENGWYVPGGWKYPLFNDDGSPNEAPPKLKGDLRAVISHAQELGIEFHPDADWGYNVDPDLDYRTGEHTRFGGSW